MVLRKDAIYFHVEHLADMPLVPQVDSDQTLKNALATFEFLEQAIREWELVVDPEQRNLDEAFRLADGKAAKEQGIN